MNSNTGYSLYNEASKDRQDQDCNCKEQKDKDVMLKFNSGNFSPTDVTFAEGAMTQTFNQPIASITVNTTCLDCTNTLIDFTGILNVTTAVSATSVLTFTLFKVCNGFSGRQAVTTFNFFVADIAGGVTASHTISFKYPSKGDECGDCCTYILELTSISNLDFGTVNYSINGIISALTVDCC